MRRRCDGTDPNLIMYVEPKTRERVDGRILPSYERSPCDCGLSFDDVQRMTIWPHSRV